MTIHQERSEGSATLYDVNRIQELNSRSPELGSFVNMLVRTNEVRRAIEEDQFEGMSSKEVFVRIWEMHTGTSPEEQAMAFSEFAGFSENEWKDALNKGRRPYGSKGMVRVFEGLRPMMFELPGFAKEQAMNLFCTLSDGALDDCTAVSAGFRDEAYKAGVILQSHLDLIHYFDDGNGRATEDWMVWWEKEYVKRHGKQDRSAFDLYGLDDIPITIDKHSIRAWFHHGMRHRVGHYQDVSRTPEFLKDEYKKQYLQDRQRLFDRMLLMNEFRRNMYGYFEKKMEYSGTPEEFEIFMNGTQERVLTVVEELYSNLTHMAVVGKVMPLMPLLEETGEYTYEEFEPDDVIRSEFLR